MEINAIGFLPAEALPNLNPLQAAAPFGAAPAATALDAGGAADGSFGAWFTRGLDQVNTRLIDADRGIQQLAAGSETNLHQVMMKLEDAKISLQLMLQVRNRLLEAYQDVIRMQL